MCKRLHTKPALKVPAHRLNEYYLLEYQGDSSSAVCSHIFREGNWCEDGLAALGHDMQDTLWFTLLPPSLGADFSRDRNEMPNYRSF
uniref:Uncharacterized protein n=1 Tax=Medicago truncatula TaxID=3880 RepID=Q1RU90_MEDTR|nr:hypothetical protein MtrDRAFT_AC153123g20v2 [Medicago truncatula]